MTKVSVAVALLIIAGGAFAGDRATVELQLPSASLLPGVPYDLNVAYQNLTDHRVSVGLLATVVVQPTNGQVFRFERHTQVKGLGNEANLDLEPGATWVGSLSWNEDYLQGDAAFAGPGSYDLWLELEGDPKVLDEPSTYVGSIRTTSAHLTRIEPKGEDAEVWARMQEAANGHWPSMGFQSPHIRTDLAGEIITKHPYSSYYPYALLFGRPGDFDRLVAAMGRFHDSPAYAHLAVQAALDALSSGAVAVNKGGSAKSIDRYFQLVEAYTDEASQSESKAVRERARVIKDRARFDLSEYHRAFDRKK